MEEAACLMAARKQKETERSQVSISPSRAHPNDLTSSHWAPPLKVLLPLNGTLSQKPILQHVGLWGSLFQTIADGKEGKLVKFKMKLHDGSLEGWTARPTR